MKQKHTQGKIDSFLIEVSETILNPEYIMTGEDNESICNLKLDGSITRDELDANAERIVKCWNMHDEMLEALKEIYNSLSSDDIMLCQFLPEKDSYYRDEIWLKKAEQVIKKAES